MTIEIYFRTGRYLATEDIQNRLNSDLFNYLCKNFFSRFRFEMGEISSFPVQNNQNLKTAVYKQYFSGHKH
jgi:hypothetical protein